MPIQFRLRFTKSSIGADEISTLPLVLDACSTFVVPFFFYYYSHMRYVEILQVRHKCQDVAFAQSVLHILISQIVGLDIRKAVVAVAALDAEKFFECGAVGQGRHSGRGVPT